MFKLDAQIHIWFSDRPSRPWWPGYRLANRDRPSYLQHAGQSNSVEMALAEMEEAGVDGALLATLGVYGNDVDLELDACARFADRFRFVGVVDPQMPDLPRHVERLKAQGLVGLRVPEMRSAERVLSGEFDSLLAACDNLQIGLHLPAANAALPQIADRYAGILFCLNHLGTGLAPPIVGFRTQSPFEDLPRIMELARHRNIALKLTGAPALSLEDYPYRDIWQPIGALISEFGADRIFWGSDYTRTAGLLSYRQGVDYLAEMPDLSAEQLALLYGGALAAHIGWNGGSSDKSMANAATDPLAAEGMAQTEQSGIHPAMAPDPGERNKT